MNMKQTIKDYLVRWMDRITFLLWVGIALIVLFAYFFITGCSDADGGLLNYQFGSLYISYACPARFG